MPPDGDALPAPITSTDDDLLAIMIYHQANNKEDAAGRGRNEEEEQIRRARYPPAYRSVGTVVQPRSLCGSPRWHLMMNHTMHDH